MHCMFTPNFEYTCMLGVFSHAYRQAIQMIMLQLVYSSRLVCRYCECSSWNNYIPTLIWHPLYLSFQLTTCSHQNSSFAMLCAVFNEFKYANLSSTLLSHQAADQAYTCFLTSCLVQLLISCKHLTDNT